MTNCAGQIAQWMKSEDDLGIRAFKEVLCIVTGHYRLSMQKMIILCTRMAIWSLEIGQV